MLNFRQGGDTGYNEDDSVQPYSNAEKANQIVFRRPPENLRKRHEVLRLAFDHLEAVVGSDRGLRMMSDPDVFVTWDGISSGPGNGIFSIPNAKELRIVPIISAAGEGMGDAIPAHLRYEPVAPGGAYFRVKAMLIDDVTPLKAFEGGNNIFFELTAGASLTITVDGSTDPAEGPAAVRATYIAGVTTWGALVTAINADADAEKIVTSFADGALNAVAITADDDVTYQRLSDGNSAGVTGTVVGYGGIDAEGFVLTGAQIATFFTTVANRLDEGDSLVLDFVDAATRRAKLESDDVSGALQTVHYDATDPLTGTVANLHSVPICKVFNGNLHFLNGTVVGPGGPVSLMQTDSPFVIVGPGGHYLTVQAALTALGSTGGTIFIKSGIYDENLTIADIDYDITLIGEAVDVEAVSKGVVLINDGANDLLTVAGTGISARTTFENIRFEQDNAAGRILAADCESASERARITFRDCAFLHSDNTAAKLFDHSINLEFFDCYFKGTQDTALNMATVFRPYAKATAGVTHLRVERCYFEKFAVIAEIGEAAQADVGSLVFRDNTIYECGKTTAVGVVGVLFKMVTDRYADFDISSNTWNNGATDEASGCFCFVKGGGSVSNNLLKRGVVIVGAPTQEEYIIRVERGVSDGNFSVENNRMHPGRGNCIAGDHAIIRGNYIKDFHPGIIPTGIGLGDEAEAISNTILVAAAATVTRVITTAGVCTHIRIINNNIVGMRLNNVGIRVQATVIGAIIRGNLIGADDPSYASGVGIEMGGLNCVVTENQIDVVFYGIQLTSDAANGNNLIAKNVIELNDDDNSHGIEVDLGCPGNAIMGNIIHGGAGAAQIGIDLNGLGSYGIIGNMIGNCDFGIFNPGSSCGVRGNHATNVLTFTGLPVDTQTVTIGGKAYQFLDILGVADGDVLIGGTASASIDNLVAAIMLDAGAGATYAAATTRHPTVVAIAGAGDTMNAMAKVEGVEGEAITVAETLANAAWGGGLANLEIELSPFALGFNWR